MHYETVGGQVTQGMNYLKMLDLLRELQEATALQGHLVRAQGSTAKDNALADGWICISENLKMMERFVTTMAQGKTLQ
jgi:hypothetical protein